MLAIEGKLHRPCSTRSPVIVDPIQERAIDEQSERSISVSTERALLGAITLLALGLRLHGLTSQPLWFDEVQTLVRADASSPLGVIAHELRDVQAPLHDLLTWLLAKCFGTGELVLRLPAALFGTALVPVTFALSKAVFGARNVVAALFAAALVAISPVVVAYAQEGRPYALFALLAAIVTLAAARIVRSHGAKGAWLLAGTAPLLVLTHYYGALVLAAVALHLLFTLAAWRERIGRVAAAFLPALAAGLLWSPIALWQFTGGTYTEVYAPIGGAGFLLALDTWTLEGAAAYAGERADCWYVELALAVIGALLLLLRRWNTKTSGVRVALEVEGDRRLRRRVVITLFAASGALLLLGAIWPRGAIERLAANLLREGRELDADGRVFIDGARGAVFIAGGGVLLIAGLVRSLPAVARRLVRPPAPDPLLPLVIALPFAGIALLDLLGRATFVPRHTIYVAAPLAVLAAGAIAAPKRRLATRIVLLVLLLATSARAFFPGRPIHAHPDFRRVGALAREQPGLALFARPQWTNRCIEYYAGRPWRSLRSADDVECLRRFAAEHERFVLVTSYEDLLSSAPALAAINATHKEIALEEPFGVRVVTFERR